MQRILLALFLAVAAHGAFAATPAERVEAAERELVAAIGARDLAVYDRLVDDDYLAARPGKPDQAKREIMDAYRAGKLILHKLEIHDVKVRVHGDTAILTATATNEREEGGHIVPSEVRYLRVWTLRGGHWRALAQMAAPQQSPAP